MSKKKKLTEKQKLFCKEYLVDVNATQAAIRAGYSEKTARSIGQENLTKPDIQQYIQELMNERSKKTEITAERVLEEIAKLAFCNTKNFHNEDGTLKKINEISDEDAAAIQEVSYDETDGGLIIKRKYKIANKISSLELLGKHLKLFTDKVEHSGPNGGPIETVIKEMSPKEAAKSFRDQIKDT